MVWRNLSDGAARRGAGRARSEPIAAHRPANHALAQREASNAPRQQTRSVRTFSLCDLLEIARWIRSPANELTTN